MLKVMHIFMEHVHLLWHLMAFYIRNLAAKGLTAIHFEDGVHVLVTLISAISVALYSL